jgi:uncharacterized membrane protein
MRKTRLEAFSDGVIAIIITIMVLELRIPGGADWHVLGRVLPVFSTYTLSFVLVAIYWVNHHHLLHVVKRINAGIMWSNVNLLFWLSLIPFATGWMGENHFQPLPVALYATLMVLCGIAYHILQKTIEKSHKNDPRLAEFMGNQSRKGIISLIAYALAVPLAFVNTIISGLIFLFVAVVWLIPDKKSEEIENE